MQFLWTRIQKFRDQLAIRKGCKVFCFDAFSPRFPVRILQGVLQSIVAVADLKALSKNLARRRAPLLTRKWHQFLALTDLGSAN